MEVIFYTTLGCHLCEQAKELLDAITEGRPSFKTSIQDIADSEELIERYGVRIPVIQRRDTLEELGWPFDADLLAKFLT